MYQPIEMCFKALGVMFYFVGSDSKKRKRRAAATGVRGGQRRE